MEWVVMAESAARTRDINQNWCSLSLIFIISKYLSIIISSALGLWQHLQMDHIPADQKSNMLLLVPVWQSQPRSSGVNELNWLIASEARSPARMNSSGTNYSAPTPGFYHVEAGAGDVHSLWELEFSVARWRRWFIRFHCTRTSSERGRAQREGL